MTGTDLPCTTSIVSSTRNSVATPPEWAQVELKLTIFHDTVPSRAEVCTKPSWCQNLTFEVAVKSTLWALCAPCPSFPYVINKSCFCDHAGVSALPLPRSIFGSSSYLINSVIFSLSANGRMDIIRVQTSHTNVVQAHWGELSCQGGNKRRTASAS